jgi:bifunctional DNase/RNase
MSLVRLNIKGISYSQTQNGAYALILSEVDGDRKLPIVIGAFEAQSIAIALEKEIMPPRPLTHDLFKNFSDRFQIVVKQVIIHKLVDGVFYSSIIFTYKGILEKAGISLKSDKKKKKKKIDEDAVIDELLLSDDAASLSTGTDELRDHTLTELNKMLDAAVHNEDYEEAAKIRDEISKRN